MHDSTDATSRTKALLPDAEVELWTTATHALPAEHPEDVNQRILGFVDRHT